MFLRVALIADAVLAGASAMAQPAPQPEGDTWWRFDDEQCIKWDLNQARKANRSIREKKPAYLRSVDPDAQAYDKRDDQGSIVEITRSAMV